VLFAAPSLENKKLEKCAVDWSLKTRVRFTSKTKFTFSTTLKTAEEASGITGFVRCVNPGGAEDLSSLDTSTNAQFHQCCLYWQYPWLPWMSLFPRDSRTPVTSPTTTSNIGMDPHISTSLLHDWCENFRSLFGLLRARQCPYFYVCTHQFNVLFRAAGIGGVEETHALMTPTTKGLRDILRRDDIQFSMPLRKSSHGETNQSEGSGAFTKVNNDGDDDDGDDEDDDNEDDWISDIGLHSNLRSKLEAERLQDGGQGTSQGSYHDSLILIEDTETQGLFNWLMNSKLCISSTGPLAGIPPTLLSPVAFHGATLRPLKVCTTLYIINSSQFDHSNAMLIQVRQGLLKQDGESMYSLEVQGPILPHSVVSLMSLLQTGDYKCVSSVVPSTKPLADFQSENSSGASAFGKENLSDCGLDGKALDLFCSSQPYPTTTNEINFNNGSFCFGS